MAEDVAEGPLAAEERTPARRRLRMGAGLFGMLLASIAGLALRHPVRVLPAELLPQ
jgi:hypothetical protein